MHDKLMKMLGKKRDLSEHEKMAKMHVMKEMRDEAADAMHNKLGSIKKVSVMAPDKASLQEGLEKAHEMVEDQKMAHGGEVMSDEEEHEMLQDAENAGADAMHAHEEHEGEEGHEESESPEEEMSEDDEDLDAIEAKIAELMKKKEKLASK